MRVVLYEKEKEKARSLRNACGESREDEKSEDTGVIDSTGSVARPHQASNVCGIFRMAERREDIRYSFVALVY